MLFSVTAQLLLFFWRFASYWWLTVQAIHELNRTSECPLVEHLHKQRHTVQFTRIPSKHFLIMSEDSTTSPGNLCHCPVTHTAQKILSDVQWEPPSHLLLSWNCAPMKRAWISLLCIFPSGVYGHWRDPPVSPLLQAEQSQQCQPFLTGKVL